MTLVELKQSLHIDGNFNDTYLQSLMTSAISSLLPTIGFSENSKIEDVKRYASIQDRYITEYVRGFYFHIDNQKTLDALQMQLQSLILDDEV